MLTHEEMRAVLTDLWHYGFVHLEDPSVALQLVTLLGDEARLASDGAMWRVSVDLYSGWGTDGPAHP